MKLEHVCNMLSFDLLLLNSWSFQLNSLKKEKCEWIISRGSDLCPNMVFEKLSTLKFLIFLRAVYPLSLHSF